MMVAALSASLVVVGCAGSSSENDAAAERAALVTAEPLIERTYALGSEVNADGAIPRAASSEAFRKGHEVYLSVNVTSASTPQKIAVEWVDPAGRVVRRDQRDVPVDRMFVAFSSGTTGTWPSGSGRAVVIIDGRRVTELPFEIVG